VIPLSLNDVLDTKENRNNVPIPARKSVPNENLVPTYGSRKYIKSDRVQALAERKYEESGKGITIEDIERECEIGKNRAQRKVKHLLRQKTLFTAQDLQNEGITIRGVNRERPQRYYPFTCKTKMMERLTKKNVLKDTTEYMVPETGLQKAHNFHDVLTQLALYLLYIHKLQIWTSVPEENYELTDWTCRKGTAKSITERIGIHMVEFHIPPNGSVMVYVSCSEQPFRLQYEQDVSDILFFLVRVEERIRLLLSDVRDSVLPPMRRWILKACDVGKDVEIDSVAQITLPDVQVPLFEKALRGYVKPIGNKVFYRMEYAITPNKPIKEALECLRREIIIDANCFSLSC